MHKGAGVGQRGQDVGVRVSRFWALICTLVPPSRDIVPRVHRYSSVTNSLDGFVTLYMRGGSYDCIMGPIREQDFEKELRSLRALAQQQRRDTNIANLDGSGWLDVQSRGGRYDFFFDDGTDQGRLVRIMDRPNTLSGDVLRLHAALPSIPGHFEVDGNEIRPLDHLDPWPSPERDDDHDDAKDNDHDIEESDIVRLPFLQVDQSKHHVKRPKYKSEVENLLACQNGSCENPSQCSSIVRLLGRCSNTEIVFPKQHTRQETLSKCRLASTYARWLLQIAAGLRFLHSKGIIYKDLRIDNLVFSSDGQDVFICDLESKWGNRDAPEVDESSLTDVGWSERSDIYDFGNLIRHLLIGNYPLLPTVQWTIPEPFESIATACTADDPFKRPALDELATVFTSIVGSDCMNP